MTDQNSQMNQVDQNSQMNQVDQKTKPNIRNWVIILVFIILPPLILIIGGTMGILPEKVKDLLLSYVFIEILVLLFTWTPKDNSGFWLFLAFIN